LLFLDFFNYLDWNIVKRDFFLKKSIRTKQVVLIIDNKYNDIKHSSKKLFNYILYIIQLLNQDLFLIYRTFLVEHSKLDSFLFR